MWNEREFQRPDGMSSHVPLPCGNKEIRNVAQATALVALRSLLAIARGSPCERMRLLGVPISLLLLSASELEMLQQCAQAMCSRLQKKKALSMVEAHRTIKDTNGTIKLHWNITGNRIK